MGLEPTQDTFDRIIDTLLPRLDRPEIIEALYLDDPAMKVPPQIVEVLKSYVDENISMEQANAQLLQLKEDPNRTSEIVLERHEIDLRGLGKEHEEGAAASEEE